MPNFSTTFFNSTIPELSNTYSELEISNDSENESTDNIGLPSLSYLIVLVFLVSTIMDVVEMLDLYVSWFAIVTDQDLSGASLFSLMFLF
jgi:hypothetical protein